MIDYTTILSTTQDKLTLLQWLKKVEDALKSGSATAVKGTTADDGSITLSIEFADGTSLVSEPIATGKLPDGYDIDSDGNVTINGALHVSKTGDVEIGKNAVVDGTLTLNAPEDLAFKTGALDCSKAKYQHSVWITSPAAGTYPLSIHFTAMSSKNTPIDSYQDLIDVFGGERLSVTGYAADKNAPYGVGEKANAIFIDLHGGTLSTDYVGIFAGGETQEHMDKIYLSSPASVFLQISDDVCIPK